MTYLRKAPRARSPQSLSLARRCRVAVAAASLSLLSAQSAAQQNGADDRAALLAIESQWNEAIRAADGDRLDKLLAPGFELIFSPEKAVDRAEVIASLAKRSWQITENGSRDQNVRVYGDTAVITGVYFEKGLVSSQSYSLEARYTDVYARRDGSWIAVSAHSSPNPPVMKARE